MTSTACKAEKQIKRGHEPWRIAKCVACQQRIKPFTPWRMLTKPHTKPGDTRWVAYFHAGCVR